MPQVLPVHTGFPGLKWRVLHLQEDIVIILKIIYIYNPTVEKRSIFEVTSCGKASIIVYTYHMKFSTIFYFQCISFLLPYFSIRTNQILFTCFIIFKLMVHNLSCILKLVVDGYYGLPQALLAAKWHSTHQPMPMSWLAIKPDMIFKTS